VGVSIDLRRPWCFLESVPGLLNILEPVWANELAALDSRFLFFAEFNLCLLKAYFMIRPRLVINL